MSEGKPFPADPRPSPGPGPAGSWPVVAAILAATAFLLVVGGGYLAVTRSDVLAGGSGPSPLSGPRTQAVPTTAPGSSSGPGTWSPGVPGAPVTTPPRQPTRPTTPAGIAALPEQAAAELLADQAAHDETGVRALRGSWVPQVSSKCVGVRADLEPDWFPDGTAETPSVTTPQIAAFHQALQLRFGALTTRPTALGIDQDYATAGACQGQLVWISIVPLAFSGPNTANGWCDANGIPTEECLARKVEPGGRSEFVARG
ncbi:hypothetical protein MXD62_01925 [Frankia sp. Mgl5]|uniref:hypothetical protein n=1 Tax=Frankia sp. Mgl5 TaxID=2933793 RepID=UPI00200FE59E|nr:hypothetical protein [Frankia sp. Mgl5]MCK9925929.1 hypothetical protein [Frankia sp. Mgl5]